MLFTHIVMSSYASAFVIRSFLLNPATVERVAKTGKLYRDMQNDDTTHSLPYVPGIDVACTGWLRSRYVGQCRSRVSHVQSMIDMTMMPTSP